MFPCWGMPERYFPVVPCSLLWVHKIWNKPTHFLTWAPITAFEWSAMCSSARTLWTHAQTPYIAEKRSMCISAVHPAVCSCPVWSLKFDFFVRVLFSYNNNSGCLTSAAADRLSSKSEDKSTFYSLKFKNLETSTRSEQNPAWLWVFIP